MNGLGLQLYEPLVVNGQKITQFNYNADEKKYVSNDPMRSVTFTETSVPLGTFFPTNGWVISTSEGDIGSAFENQLESTKDFMEQEDFSLGSMVIGDVTVVGLEDARPGIIIFGRDPENDQVWVHLILEFIPNGNNEMTIRLVRMGAGSGDMEYLTTGLVNAICSRSPYLMEPDPTGSVSIRLTSKANAQFYFTAQLLN